MMGLHKITAGNGYVYLTQQTISHDVTRPSGQDVADYYSEKGENPGRWMGAGLAGLGGVASGEVVTEAQMLALFGEGKHPNANEMQARLIKEKTPLKKVRKAIKLGRTFTDYDNEPSPFRIETSKRYEQWLDEHGLPRKAEVPEDVRAIIRTEVGKETFRAEHGRLPDERELSAHVARSTRPKRQCVAGYDLTFSPVKSVSVLWALADQETAHVVAEAHDAAVADALGWIEREVASTRTGTNGIQHRDVNGLIAAAFTHRDSRAGDPDLHTHVAVSNKVQVTGEEEGKNSWYALDGTVLYKSVVAASERYNTALERELHARLGVEFTAHTTRTGARPIREITGIPAEWLTGFSARRADIESATKELQAQFVRDHGRAPTPKESHALYQTATLDTRPGKHEARSEAEQRAAWHTQAIALAGGDADAITTCLTHVLAHKDQPRRTRELTPHEITDLAGMIRHDVQHERARFQIDHVTAETQRRIRALNLAPNVEQTTVDHVIARVLDDPDIIRLDASDGVNEPVFMRRKDGTSVYDRPRARLYTTTGMLAAERTVLDGAHARTTHHASEHDVALALLESVANGITLNPSQTNLVTDLATSPRAVRLALAPAGTGKTTSMRVLAAAWKNAHPLTSATETTDETVTRGGGVIGLAPTAVAARELGAALNAPAETLAKLTYHLHHPGTQEPEWMRAISAGTLLIVDEAGMASTTDLADVITFARTRDAVVRLVGDDQQLASISAGGVLRDIAHETGSVTLSEVVRFTNPAEAAATLALREGDKNALGFLLDHDRVHVTSEGDLETRVYQAWKTSTDAGDSALMLAMSKDAVAALNMRARTDRITAGVVSDGPVVRLHDGLTASVGDMIVTRRNRRDLALSPTDFVKNGDRWSITAVHDDGAITAHHDSLGTSIVLPANYVAEHVELGYASTVHGAQGQTVDASYLLARGQETRQQFYVAMSRGRAMNAVFVPTGSDGSEHEQLHEDRINPATAVEMLEEIIARDDAPVSATTQQREAADPARLLQEAAARYADAVTTAALRYLGTDGVEALTREVEELCPGLTDEVSWEPLLGKLALLATNDHDPIALLGQAMRVGELTSARDQAAVLLWRLDPKHELLGHGALLWQPGIPSLLADDPECGPWLKERADLVRRHASEGSRLSSAWARGEAPAPAWARDLVPEYKFLATQIWQWRAAHHIPDTDPSLTGPAVAALDERDHQKYLEGRYAHFLGRPGAPGLAFVADLNKHAPGVTKDPYWPILAHHLDAAISARLPVRDLLRDAVTSKPLPDEYPAAALWARLQPVLQPVITTTSSPAASRLRPTWTNALIDALDSGVGEGVTSDPGWNSLVAAVHHTSLETGLPPEQVITAAADIAHLDGLDAGAITHVLTLRVTDLLRPATDEADPRLVDDDQFWDAEIEDFLATTVAEQDTPRTQSRVRDRSEPQWSYPEPPPEFVEDSGWDLAEPPPEFDDEPPPENEEDLAPSEHELAAQAARARLVELTAAAGEFYASRYAGSASQTYIQQRFGTDLRETPFLLGHAGSESDALVRHVRQVCQATDAELVEAGLARYNTRRADDNDSPGIHDYFRNRVLIGVHDTDGTLVGFNGRDLTDRSRAKYLNTPATALFTKGATLFGLYEGRESSMLTQPDVVGVEGPMDAIAVTLAGGGEVIGVAGGTGGFTTSQITALSAYARTTSSSTLWLAKDNDRAGRAALAKDTTSFLGAGIVPRALPVMGGKDLADMWQDMPEMLETTLGMREQFPVSSRFVMYDLASAAHLESADLHTRAHTIEQISAVIAQLPPLLWDAEIDHAVRLFAPAGDLEGYDWYARTVYESVITHALGWDHSTHIPSEGSSVLRAARDLTHLREILSEHGTRQPVKTADQILDDLSAQLAQQNTKPPSSTRKPPTSRQRIRRDDDPRHDQDGPTHDPRGPRY